MQTNQALTLATLSSGVRYLSTTTHIFKSVRNWQGEENTLGNDIFEEQCSPADLDLFSAFREL